jgi:hypothetical protein
MTAIELSTESRTVLDRITSSVAVILGAAFWLGGLHLFLFFGAQWRINFDNLGIPGGLPAPTELAMNLHGLLASHPVAIHAYWAVATLGLLAAAALVRDRQTFRWVGALAIIAFFVGYAALAFFAFAGIMALFAAGHGC